MHNQLSDPNNLIFEYRLGFSDGKTLSLSIVIDSQTQTFVTPVALSPPFWSRLEYQQCENCPLKSSEVAHCPVAYNLIPLLELCAASLSYENVELEVTTRERSIRAATTLQRALSSILGLIMATSPCPHTEFLKPMARFHLPLASQDETIYRASSMFLLAQYFRHKAGLSASLDLDGLTEIYRQLQTINRALAKRFRAAISEDATLNAIVLLDLLSQSVNWSIEDGLDELRHLFKAYELPVTAWR